MATHPRDRVHVEGLELEASIGVYAHEKKILQKLIIDITVETDLDRAGKSDSLADAIDYDHLAAVARQASTERHHQLIETVAHEIATRILDDLRTKATAVFVRVKKPSAVPGAKYAAVEIWREHRHS